MLIEPVQGQAADPLGRPIPESRYRTREAFLDIFSKASLKVERSDATTVPFDTIFVLAPAAPGEIVGAGVAPNHRDPSRFSLRADLRPLDRDVTVDLVGLFERRTLGGFAEREGPLERRCQAIEARRRLGAGARAIVHAVQEIDGDTFLPGMYIGSLPAKRSATGRRRFRAVVGRAPGGETSSKAHTS